MKYFIIAVLIASTFTMNSQKPTTDSLPYASVPEAYQDFTPGTVVARMVDGLGFRYRWATEGLSQADYGYAPPNDGRTVAELIEHIYGLSKIIVNTAKKQATDYTLAKETLTLEETRIKTLENFKMASERYATATDLNEHKLLFKRASSQTEFSFWTNLNGPIEDAVWHAGQIAVLRRSTGNPMNPKVNVFSGKVNK